MDNIVKTFEGLTNLQKTLVLIILSVVVYSISTSATYTLFSKVSNVVPSAGNLKSALPSAAGGLVEDPNEPKTESCPLNGAMHTKKAKEFWTQRRPLAVMIENHSEARPQSGLSSADVVYEAVAEGGI